MEKPFVLTVTETLIREVIVYAEDRYSAIERVEDMCNDSIINLTSHDFDTRDVKCEGLADADDWGDLSVYGHKRYFTSNGEISEEEANAINEKNMILLESGDFEKMKDVKFVYWQEGKDDRETDRP